MLGLRLASFSPPTNAGENHDSHLSASCVVAFTFYFAIIWNDYKRVFTGGSPARSRRPRYLGGPMELSVVERASQAHGILRSPARSQAIFFKPTSTTAGCVA